jgi:hypothetical protein
MKRSLSSEGHLHKREKELCVRPLASCLLQSTPCYSLKLSILSQVVILLNQTKGIIIESPEPGHIIDHAFNSDFLSFCRVLPVFKYFEKGG